MTTEKAVQCLPIKVYNIQLPCTKVFAQTFVQVLTELSPKQATDKSTHRTSKLHFLFLFLDTVFCKIRFPNFREKR